METVGTREGAPGSGKGRWPEAALAILAAVVFLGSLGSLELWGKREQRLAAEALDTVDHGRWLVARIQGRPRLEKPPLPRWATASLMLATGRRDETIVRIPGAIAGLGTVALTYLLGVRLGGRPLGLASAIILAATPLFISEARQAGQDVPLAFFATLAVLAAVRFLEPDARTPRRWALTFHLALAAGLLCKGPVILAIAATALVPWACLGGFAPRLAALATNPFGLSASLAVALGWAIPAALADPNAVGVWLAEMGQKTGASGIVHRGRASFLAQWPAMILPWVVVGASGLFLPFRRREGPPPGIWLAWSWSIGGAALFGFWAVAKPNYYIPCLPGFALLAGAAWLRLDSRALGGAPSRAARLLTGLQWALWSALGAAALPAAGRATGHGASLAAWCGVTAVAAAGAGALGVVFARRGGGALALFPGLAATALAVLVGYGVVAPSANAARGHRGVALAIDRALPAGVHALDFFHELDEGLWFYLKGRRLTAVPGSQPRYNDAYDRIASGDAEAAEPGLIPRSKRVLAAWLRDEHRPVSYLLLRDKVYGVLGPELAGWSTVLLREGVTSRGGLVLLRVDRDPALASSAGPDVLVR